MKVLDLPLLTDVLLKHRPQRLLCLVRLKGRDLGLEVIPNIDRSGLRREGNGRTSGNRYSGSRVVQLSSSMGSNSVF